MRKRDVLSSPRLNEIKKKKRLKIGIKFLIGIFVLILLLSGIAILSRSDKINIKIIEVKGVNSIDTRTVEELIKENISGHYLYFFPKSNIFILPKNKIRYELENNHKQFKNIELKIVGTTTLVVTLSVREAQYLWCGEEFLSTELKSCYFMDENGFIYDNAPYFSGDVYFKFFGKIDFIDNPIGAIFQSVHFEKISLLKELLKEINIEPIALYLREDGDMELYLSSSADDIKPKIIFNPDADVVKMSENLQSALLTDPLMSDFKDKYNKLQYIDLRFGNKVYYKFR